MSQKPLRVRNSVLLLLVLVTGCGPILFEDRCGPEIRQTSIGGEILDPTGARLGTAEILLVEVRGGAEPRRLQAILMGPSYGSEGAPLKGNVTRATLKDAAGEVLYELPVAPGLGDEVLQTVDVLIEDAAVFDALKRRFVAGEVMLDLETRLSGSEGLRFPLPLQRAGNWDRAHCS